MEKNYLVLGATGSIGYAFTKELLANGEKVKILVRNREKAEKLFSGHILLSITEGDVNDLDLLKSVSKDTDFIFHGINYPFQSWDKYMKPLTHHVIEAAEQNKATVLFPGNIYEFGNIKTEITEKTIAKPATKKGKLRYELFQILKDAAENKQCKIIFLRLPDFYGPNVTNGLIKPIFGNAAKGKAISWLIRSDIPHQFIYTPDAAKVFYKLSKEKDLPDFFLLNYGGEIVDSIDAWALKIAEITNGSNKVKRIPKPVLSFLSLFVPVVKELRENFYQFENSILLNDDKLKLMYPDFKAVSTEKALKDTIQWWQNSIDE